MIGWVYETNRNKVKTAQQNIDAFNRQDKINDIEESKENDLKRIADEIEGWDDYLEALEWQYEQWQHEENMRLLKEVLGVETDKEVYDLLKEDMKAYREYRKNAIDGNQMFADIQVGITGKIASLGQNFDWLGNRVVVLGQEINGTIEYFTYSIEEANRLWGYAINEWMESGKPFWQWLMEGFDGVFQHFLDEHYENEKEYHDLMREELDLLDIDDFLIGNELPEGWDLPDYIPPDELKKKKKEIDPIYNIVLNDAELEKAKQARGEEASKFWTTVTTGDGSKLSRLDISGLMEEDVEKGNWFSAIEHSILRTSAIEAEGIDLQKLGWRTNAEVLADAMEKAGIYEAISSAFLKNYNENDIWEAANIINEYSQLAQENTVTSELNQGMLGIIGMLSTNNNLSEDQIAGIADTIASMNLLSGELDSTSDMYSGLASKALTALNGMTGSVGNLYDALMGLYGMDSSAQAIEYMNKVDLAYQAHGGEGSFFINKDINYTDLLHQATDAHDYLTALRAGIVRDTDFNIRGIDALNSGLGATKEIILSGLNTQNMSKAQLQIVNHNLDNLDATYQNAANISHTLAQTGNDFLNQNKGILSGMAITLPTDMQNEAQKMIETAVINSELMRAAVGEDVESANLNIDANTGLLSDKFTESSDLLKAALGDNFKEAIASDASYYDQVIELLRESNASKDAVQSFNDYYESIGGTYSGSNWGSDGYSSSDYDNDHPSTPSTPSVGNATGSYGISSQKGYEYAATLSTASAGTQLKGGDGSTWTSNGDGSFTIEKNGTTWVGSSGNSNNAAGGIHFYSGGLEEGPVTYTGLAMLHGSSNRPEYVLNSDQAYNVLHYIAAGNKPQNNIESYNNNAAKTTQYIVEGDIILENCDNPAEFWDEVTTAMGNRWNVTKNR